MNIKKLVSAVSALAVAGSVFTGLAVTSYAEALTSKYGQIVGIDFGDTDSGSPFANTVDLQSAEIDGYTYQDGDGNFTGGLAVSNNISTDEIKLGKDPNKHSAGLNHLLLPNATGTVSIPAALQIDTTKDKVNVNFNMAWGPLSSKFTHFYIYSDSTKLVSLRADTYKSSFSENSLGIAISDFNGSNTNNGADWAKKVNFDITLDYATKKISAKVGNSSYTGDLVADAGAVTSFEVGSNYDNGDRYCLFDDLKITNIEGQSARDVTIKRYCEDQLIDSVIEKVTAGEGYTVDSKYTQDFEKREDVKTVYKYDSENQKNKTSVTADENEISLYFTKTEYNKVSNIKVNYKDNETDLNADSATRTLEDKYVGEQMTYYYPKYLKVDNQWYVSDASTYGQQVTLADSNEYTVEYNTAAENIVYFNDCDKENGTNTAYSNGTAAVYGGDSAHTPIGTVTLNKGEYKAYISVVAKAGSGTNHRGEKIVINDEDVAKTTGNDDKVHELTFTVTEDSTSVKICGQGTNDATDTIDYVMIEKTGEYEPPVVTPEPVSAEHDRDFTTNGDHASVWKATVNGISADASYTKIVATATSTSQGDKKGEVSLPTIATGNGSVLVYVVIGNVEDVTSVKVTLE